MPNKPNRCCYSFYLIPGRTNSLEQLHNTVGLADLLATDHDLPFGSLDYGSPLFNYNTTANRQQRHCLLCVEPKVKLLGSHHQRNSSLPCLPEKHHGNGSNICKLPSLPCRHLHHHGGGVILYITTAKSYLYILWCVMCNVCFFVYDLLWCLYNDLPVGLITLEFNDL